MSARTLLLVVLVLTGNLSAAQTSSDYPDLNIQILDSSQVSPGLLSIDVFDYLEPNRAHMLVLGAYGEPKVHFWADGGPQVPIMKRPRVSKWWEGQSLWTTLYVQQDVTPATYLHSTDLEEFEVYEIGYELDGHAIELTDYYSTITLVATTQTVFDEDDLVPGDSIGVRWTEWVIDDQMGGLEYVPLSLEYSNLDIHGIGLPGGPNQEILDPLHGNSIDSKQFGSKTYVGSTMRTINEALIMKDDLGVKTFYHFGGPLNQFTYSTDSVLPFKAHDLRFLSVSDTTALVTFFSNGDGHSVGGDYAAGKTVLLNFVDLTADLIDQQLLPFGLSNAMGSYSSETGTIAPGVWVDTLINIQPVLAIDLDSNGNEIMRIEHTFSQPKFSYQANRYPISVDQTLLRPTLELSCDQGANEMHVSIGKLGFKDSYQMFVDDVLWSGPMLNDSTMILPWNFEGSVNGMSRYWVQEFGFTVDKYSDILEIEENYCSTLVGVEAKESDLGKIRITDRMLYVHGRTNASIINSEGRLLIENGRLPMDLNGLSAGVYLVLTQSGTSKIIIP